MHIIIGLLGSIVTILYLLTRLTSLGLDFSRLNPFHWRRRRAWAKKYQGDPIYTIEDPMQVAALLIVGAAKLDGDLTAEQKKMAMRQFESKFSSGYWCCFGSTWIGIASARRAAGDRKPTQRTGEQKRENFFPGTVRIDD